ncbi:MAG: DUF1993 family protein [Novosphingobium sp.]
MAFSLHSASVGTYLQILPSVAGLIDKAEAHCRENGLADEALTACSLAPDMWPLAKQVFECGHHSARCIEGLCKGVFGPEIDAKPTDFPSLKREIAESITMLQAVEPAEIDAMVGRDMRFEFGERRMDFTAEDFVLTFSLPNFYFHANTVYDILRGQGLKIGKMDYLGAMRLKQ